MNLDEYQTSAALTDVSEGDGESLLIPLLGLVGEAGSLLTEYKKLLRDNEAHLRYREQMAEEIGDVLWYISSIATRLNLKLSDVAIQNLVKVKDRWTSPTETPSFLDEEDPVDQQLPREFTYKFESRCLGGRQVVVVVDEGGATIGDPLSDNSYHDDGYRYHDVIHLAFATKLGWSPVLRKLLGCKRKHDPVKDEVEDGARAAAIEEALATAVAEYALRHGHLQGTEKVDWELLRLAKRMTANLEVSVRTEFEWEDAMVTGIRAWSDLHQRNGGIVRGNLRMRTLELDFG